MSHPRRDGRPEPLTEGALDFLRRGLRQIGRATDRSHLRSSGRLAISYRPCRRDRDSLPGSRVAFDKFRLFSLSHRWVERDGRLAPVLLLAIYRAELDLPGTGRVRFACAASFRLGGRGGRLAPDPATNATGARSALLMAQAVEDAEAMDLARSVAFPRFYYGFEDRRPPVFEPARSPRAWAEAAIRIGNRAAWPAEFFARDERARWSTNPVDGSANPWQDGPGGSPEGLIRGSWILRDGVPTPMAQEPAAVYADLSGLVGRSVRNPAYSVLQARGILPEHQTYRQWLEAISPMTREGGRTPVDRAPGGRGRAFLDTLGDWLAADPGHAEGLLGDLRDACHALGVPVPGDPEEALEFLGDLAQVPWSRPEVPGAADIQRIDLGSQGPDTLRFASAVVGVDLADLGPLAGRYQPVEDRRVRELFDQRWAAPGAGSGWGGRRARQAGPR